MKSFLIVEDNRFFGNFCEEILRKNYDCSYVDYASSGSEALERVRSKDYSVIVSDIVMPDMDGIEFYERLKEELPSVSKRVVFISGKLNEFHTTYLTREKRPYLAKPFAPEDLLNLTDKILKLGENSSGLEDFECRREHVRLARSVGCTCVPVNQSWRSSGLTAETIDFSRGGLGIKHEGKKLSKGTKVYVTVEELKLFNEMADVVWSEEKGKREYRSGLKWARPIDITT